MRNSPSAEPVNRMFLEGWKQASVTEARWPLRTATGSGGGRLLILRLLCVAASATIYQTGGRQYIKHLEYTEIVGAGKPTSLKSLSRLFFFSFFLLLQTIKLSLVKKKNTNIIKHETI